MSTLGVSSNSSNQAPNEGPKKTKDIGWKYGTVVNPNNRDLVRCNFCQKDCKGGIYRLKQHLAGTSTNVTACLKVTVEAKEEIREHMQQSKQAKIEKKCMIREAESRDDLFKGAFSARGSSDEVNQIKDIALRPPRLKGPMDMFCAVDPEESKGKSIKDKKHQKEARDRVIQYIARWMYQAGIPFNTVRLHSFQTMLEAIGQFGPGLKGPSYHEVRETLLAKEIQRTQEFVDLQKKSWVKFGCTIMSDAWTDGKSRSLINFLVNSPTGTVFLKSIDASEHVKDAKLLADLLNNVIIEVGVENVIQVVTDNEASYVAAGKMLMAAHRHLFWTPCAAHCLDLILEDISKTSPIKSTIRKAKMVTTFLYGHTRVLAMMRKYTNQKNLVRAAVTRFATNFLNLESILECKDGLRRMFTSADWTANSNKWAKKSEGRKAQEIILKTSFWGGVVFALKVFNPLVMVLRLVDGEKPAMGYIYEAMERAKESIKHVLNDKIDKYGPIWEIIDRRWDFQLHRPLHAAGYYLNPQFYYSNLNIDSDGEVKQGLYDCIEKLTPDLKVQDAITTELACYRNAQGFFGREIAIRQRTTANPVNWWFDFGSKTPHLQKLAIRILSLTCSASSCERNWSTFEQAAAARAKGGYPERIGQPECQYYMKTGTCKFGATCKFHHPRDKAGISGGLQINMLGYPLRPNEKECAYYLRTGQCKFGNTCKFHHPQPSNAVVSLRGSVYPTVHSPTSLGQQSYPGGLTNWPLSRASFIPSPRWQGPSSYAQLILPQGLVQVSGWNTYPGQLGSVSSPENQQQTLGTGQLYGTSQQSETTNDGGQGSLSSYRAGSLPMGLYALQRENVFPERPGERECQYYMKTGDCKFGAVCRFHHPRERLIPVPNCMLSPLGLPLRPGEPLCVFYSRYGICKFGPNCKFHHPMETFMYGLSSASSADVPAVRHLLGSSSTTVALPLSADRPVEAGRGNSRRLSLSDSRQMSSGNENTEAEGSHATSSIGPVSSFA